MEKIYLFAILFTFIPRSFLCSLKVLGMRFFLDIFIRMKHNLFHSDKINVLPNNCSKKLVKVLKNSIKEFLLSKVAKPASRNSFPHKNFS